MDGFIKQIEDMLPDWAADPVMALGILVAGWLIATLVRGVVAGAINRTGIGKKAKTTGGNIGKSIGKALFWIIILLALLMALGRFEALSGPDGPLSSLNGMMEGILGYGGQVIAAILIMGIGSIFAKVGKEATESSLEAVQADSIVTKMGLRAESSTSSLPKTAGGLVFGILLFLFLASAVKVLEIPALGDIIDTIIKYLPNVLIAMVILGLSVWIGKFVSNLIGDTLPTLGVDDSIKAISSLDGESSSTVVPSKIIGSIVFAAIVLFGAIGATEAIGIQQWSDIAYKILEIVGQVSFGAVIIIIGLFIANFVSKIVAQTSGDLAGKIFKYAAIILITFIGLDQMELGNEIVNTAFSHSLSAAAVAAGVGGALAFGLGGREWAAKKLNAWWPNSTTRKK
ncbi:MAG: mechanosensitive ion channel [Hellea sp.]|nr:mechanosensitive ion channel [Hellea sp.]